MKLRKLMFSLAISILALVALPVAAQPTTNTVAYNGFSFSFAHGQFLTSHVDIDEFAGDPVSLDQPGGPEVKHTQFIISTPETTPSFFDAPLAIRVYNTTDFANYPDQTARFQNLQKMVSDKTDLNAFVNPADATVDSSLPFLPIMPAAQALRARAQYIETPSVRGISYITVYRQDVSPFLGSEFFYTFQGYSIDGIHYISAIFKLNTALFPAEIPSDFNMDTFNADFNDYLTQSVTTLNNAQPTDFTPSLAMFDAVIQSFSFAPGSTIAQSSTEVPANTDPTFGGLTTSTWTLASYGTAEAPIPVLPEAPISLVFNQEGMTGNAGCNDYFGQFLYDKDQLSFSNVGSTLKACADNIMTQETDYLNALRSATNYQIDNGVLKITYRDGVLTYNGTGTPVVPVMVTPVIGGNANLGGLAGVNWVLSSLGPVAAPLAVPVGTGITATFTTEGVAGSAGCNQYSGTFQYDNTNLTFSPLVSTKITCDQSIMDQETAYLKALQSATAYQLINGQLQITYPDGVLTFNADTSTPIPAVIPTLITNTDPTLGGLAGVQWTLVSYGAAVAALPDANVTADFTQQGVSGNTGCNQYSGTFIYNNNTLTFSPLVSTQLACAEPILTQETAYLAALQSATSYQVTAGQLQITYPEGVLVFKSGA